MTEEKEVLISEKEFRIAEEEHSGGDGGNATADDLKDGDILFILRNGNYLPVGCYMDGIVLREGGLEIKIEDNGITDGNRKLGDDSNEEEKK